MENPKQTIKLTQFSKGAGCGCKLAPGVLEEILKRVPKGILSPKLWVGNETKDDAAVYDLGNGKLLASTADFFTPIVDDAFDFGAIAAANAISDIYAMGGTPIFALAILGWPIDKLPTDVAGDVLSGATEICNLAQIPLAGGHSIESPEPFFGLVVNGVLEQHHLKKNIGAKTGDVLILTKPLGTGLVTTALKRGYATNEDVASAIAMMKTLNKCGIAAASFEYVHAMTDVTGFGLAGHCLEMLSQNQNAEIDYNRLRLLPGVNNYMQKDAYSDGTMRNMRSYGDKVVLPTKESFYIACDPQTNGGLLIACNPTYATDLIKELEKYDSFIKPYIVGKIVEGEGKVIVTVNN